MLVAVGLGLLVGVPVRVTVLVGVIVGVIVGVAVGRGVGVGGEQTGVPPENSVQPVSRKSIVRSIE